MKYSKRQIAEVAYDINGEIQEHPVVILSEDHVYEGEGFYICAMVTSKNTDDRYTFKLTEDRIIKPLSDESQVRIHLIDRFWEDEFIDSSRINHMTVDGFRHLIDRMEEIVFGVSMEF